jgi:hypothetical protein
MVSVGLYSRTTIPTIRSVSASPLGWSNTTTGGTWTVSSTGAYSGHVTLLDGETLFCSAQVNNNTYQQYAYCGLRSSADTSTAVVDSVSGATCEFYKYNSGTGTGLHHEYKNTSGGTVTMQLWQRSSSSNTSKVQWYRILIMNDSDLAKWERASLPTTRYRKYAVDKYYMLAKWASGSFNIDGYAVNITTGGIIEVPVETIISSTALTGSGTHFFQVTVQGFTVTP